MDVKPTRKVGAAGLGGALAIILVWAVGAFTSVVIPAEVGTAIGTVFSFAAGWLVKE